MKVAWFSLGRFGVAGEEKGWVAMGGGEIGPAHWGLWVDLMAEPSFTFYGVFT